MMRHSAGAPTGARAGAHQQQRQKQQRARMLAGSPWSRRARSERGQVRPRSLALPPPLWCARASSSSSHRRTERARKGIAGMTSRLNAPPILKQPQPLKHKNPTARRRRLGRAAARRADVVVATRPARPLPLQAPRLVRRARRRSRRRARARGVGRLGRPPPALVRRRRVARGR